VTSGAAAARHHALGRWRGRVECLRAEAASAHAALAASGEAFCRSLRARCTLPMWPRVLAGAGGLLGAHAPTFLSPASGNSSLPLRTMDALRIDPHTRTFQRVTLAVPSLRDLSSFDKLRITRIASSECVPPEHYLAVVQALFPGEPDATFVQCAPYLINNLAGAKRWVLWTRDDLCIDGAGDYEPGTPAAVFSAEALATPGFTIKGGNFWRGARAAGLCGAHANPKAQPLVAASQTCAT
jgi:hypothetical protein